MTLSTPSTHLRAALPFWLSLALLPLLVFVATQGGGWLFLMPLATWWLFSLLDALFGVEAVRADVRDLPFADGQFDAVAAVWCSDDPKNPTKLCPFCLHCFCDASAEYKQQFWRHAPAPLVDELQTLSQSQDRLGDILIRMKKITTPQLLEVLIEQKETGRKLGEILVREAGLKPEIGRKVLLK